MGERAIIRQGDPTSHNGTVLEGFLDNICMGKPIAGVGHKVFCPQCKGNFAIVEGAPITQMMGMNVAVEGMKTSCGATLIATQFTDVIEVGPPSSRMSSHSSVGAAVDAVSTGSSAKAALSKSLIKSTHFDEQFQLIGADGMAMRNKNTDWLHRMVHRSKESPIPMVRPSEYEQPQPSRFTFS